MPRISLPECTIEYRTLGPADSANPPVVFVHGALVDGRLWTGVAEILAERGFYCVVPTWPLGAHTIPVIDRDVLSPARMADVVSEFLTALDLTDVTLVGNDSGGGICQFLLDAHPERIGRLVLTNCDAFDTFPPFPFNAIFALMRAALTARLLGQAVRLKSLRHSPLAFGWLAHTLDPELTGSWMAPIAQNRDIAGDFAAFARGIGRTDLTDTSGRLNRFTRPVRLVWGADDRCFTPALGRRVAALFDDSAFAAVPGATTFVALDAPAAVADAIRSVGGRA